MNNFLARCATWLLPHFMRCDIAHFCYDYLKLRPNKIADDDGTVLEAGYWLWWDRTLANNSALMELMPSWPWTCVFQLNSELHPDAFISEAEEL